jgi:uncharacterized delta-60 repeat protein
MARSFLTILLVCVLSLYTRLNLKAASPSPQTVDASFKISGTNTLVVNDLLVLPDGRIAFGGTGIVPLGILNSDGSTNFTYTSPFSPYPLTVNALAITRDEEFLKAGLWNFSGPVGPISRLNGGSDDFSFGLKTESRGEGTKVLIQNTEDDIIGVGTIAFLHQTNQAGIIRLKRTGQLDASFDIQSSAGLFVNTAAINADGQILASYTSTNADGSLTHGFGRWFENGKRDTNFSVEWLALFPSNARVTVLAHIPGTDDCFAAIEYTRNSETYCRIRRLDSMGVVLQTAEFPEFSGSIKAIGFCPGVAPAPKDGEYDQILIGGSFSKIDETPCHNLVSFSEAGTPLWMFQPDEGPNGPIHVVTGQTDGRILIGGAFDQVSGIQTTGLARLQGLGGISKTYIYWDKTEYHAFEKTGFVDIAINRRGNSDAILTVTIEAASSGVARLETNQLTFVFEPGETRKMISLPTLENATCDGRASILLRLRSDFGGNSSISYTPATLLIFDDETPGTIDPTFKLPLPVHPSAIATQPDGKVLLGYSLNGPRVLRMNTDGSLDTTFSTNGISCLNQAYAVITQIEVAPDSKIYLAGSFITSHLYGTNLIARLNSDGTLDTSFNPQLSAYIDYNPGIFALQGDGKILVAQTGVDISKIHHRQQIQLLADPPFRLYADGTLDQTFRILPQQTVEALLVQKDGRILIAGNSNFTNRGVFRFTSTGLPETNFITQTSGTVTQIAFIGDSLLIGGSFSAVNGLAAKNMARVNLINGALDSTFSCQTDGSVDRILVREDAKIYISGNFTKVNGQNRYRLARLNADGSLDSNYDPGMDFSQPPVIGLQSDGKLLATTGTIDNGPINADLIPAFGLVRLEDSGRPGQIQLVSPRIVATESDAFALIEVDRAGGSDGELSATLETLDGSALTGVNYLATNVTVAFADGEFGRKFVRIPLFSDSALTGNKTFSVVLKSGARSELSTVLIQDDQSSLSSTLTVQLDSSHSVIKDFVPLPNGSILVGGIFNSIQGIPITNLARLNPDFTVDLSFIPPETDLPPISRILLQPDGGILIGGPFTKVGTNFWGPVIRLTHSLAYDFEFNDSIAASRAVWSEPLDLRLLPNGSFLEADSRSIRRIDANGIEDSTFKFTNVSANKLYPLASGDLLAGTSDRSEPLRRFAPDGSVDTNFIVKADYNSVAAGAVREIVSDGSTGYYIGGDFTQVNGFPSARVAHLFSDGTVDTNFLSNVGTNSNNAGRLLLLNTVRTIALMDNGDLLVGGDFSEAGGKEHPLIALLDSNGQVQVDSHPLLQGTSVQKIRVLEDGNILVLGAITNVNGLKTDGFFKAPFIKELPPVVQILSPIDGTNLNVGDGIAPIEIKVDAFDPDNFLKEVRINLDGVPITTNQIADFSLNIYPPSAGPHQLKATAVDETGLSSSASATFTVTYIPFSPPLTITQTGDGIIIHYSGGQLQESEDFQVWTNVPEGGQDQQQYRVTPGAAHRFYRATSEVH